MTECRERYVAKSITAEALMERANAWKRVAQSAEGDVKVAEQEIQMLAEALRLERQRKVRSSPEEYL